MTFLVAECRSESFGGEVDVADLGGWCEMVKLILTVMKVSFGKRIIVVWLAWGTVIVLSQLGV